jgi:flagellar biosynthesis protein FlhA
MSVSAAGEVASVAPAVPQPVGRTRSGRAATVQAKRTSLSLNAETWLAIGVVVIVALLVIPLPSPALDALLALSIGLSVVVLLVTLSTRDPIEFSIFPSLLLLLTLLRLGLNVSSTRLILGRGEAGRVIAAFGDFVIGGNLVVGLVIFLILVVINFVVITKGAGRIAEVAARFTLDAMPGKQMAIDADLSAGLIDESEARRRREEIARYADFYGAMDGAAKFVRGDAIAGLIIAGINLIGGFVVGMVQHGLSAAESLQRYSLLTVGDGLVSQIPALVVSTAAGIIVTYGSSTPQVGAAVASQLTRHPRAIWVASGVLLCFAILPGLPTLPFLMLASAAGAVAWRAERSLARQAASAELPAARVEAPPDPKSQLRDLLAVDPLELEVGYALVPLVDEAQRGDLVQRIGIARKQLGLELGILVPPVRVRDNIQLPATSYQIKIRGVRQAGGEVLPQYLLALDPTGSLPPLEGIRVTDPAFGLPATWIPPERRADAELAGYGVVEPQTVITTHLVETVRRHAAELLTRQNVRELLDSLKETNPALVEDTVPQRLSLGTVHRVLQRLLQEGVPIRDLALILETLADAGETTKDPEVLAEQVRRALGSVIAALHAEADGVIRAIGVGPRLEAALMALFSARSAQGVQLLEPDQLNEALRRLSELANTHRREGRYRPLVTPPSLRVGIRRLVEPVLPQLPVLSIAELPPTTPLHNIATWEVNRAN